MKKQPTYFYSTILLLICLGILACSLDNKRNIKAYYFPLEELKDGKVYEYQPVNNDSLPPFYWYFRLTEKEEATFITSQYYDYSFTIQQLSNEEIVRNGVLLTDLFLYSTDTLTGQQTPHSVKVEWDNAFPFEVTDSTGVFLYKIYWKDFDNPQQKMRLIRNKHFMGDATYAYQGKEVECIEFLVKELLEVEEEGFQEVQYRTTELYAKGIGLVYFRKVISGNIQEYELVDRYDMTQLEQRFRESLEGNTE